MRSSLWRAGLAAAVGVLAVAGDVGAQSRTAVPIELQETRDFGMGARALGMGRAYTAVGEDVTAIVYNPAALSQIRQIEFSAGLANDDVTWTLERSGVGSQDRTTTRLEHLAFAYPYPTYRGSLVLGFAFHRMADLDRNVYMTGFVRPSSGPGDFGEVEVGDILQKGTMNGWTGAGAWDLTPQLSVGASLTYISGSRRLDQVLARGIPDPAVGGCPDAVLDEYGLYYGCPDDGTTGLFKAADQVDADLEGYTGAVGILATLENGLRFGAVVDFPKWLRYQGSSSLQSEDADYYYTNTVLFEDKITLPLSLTGGASWASRGLLVAADAKWTDWRQIDYAGDIRGPDRNYAYRSVVAWSVGAEYQFPTTPVRVRAGYFTEPLPYELIAADMKLGYGADGSAQADRYYPRADITSDQAFWTLGAGVLIQRSLTLDAAYVHGSWERRTPAGFVSATGSYVSPDGLTTREKEEMRRFFLSATFHFE